MKRRLFPFLFIFFLLQCSTPPRSRTLSQNHLTDNPTDKAKSLREEGRELYEKGNYQEAISALETSLWLDAGRNDVLYLLYYCYLSSGRYEKALKTAKEIAKNFPFQSISYQQIGLAHYWLGNKKIAIENYQRALEFEFHQPRLHFYIGIATENKEEKEKAFREAEEEYLEILKKNPKDFTSNFELTHLYLFLNQKIDSAESLLKNASESLITDTQDFPEERKILSNFHLPILEGIFLYRKEKYEEAIKKFVYAISRSPQGAQADLSELYYYMGLSKNALGEKEVGKMMLEKSLELDKIGPFGDLSKKTIRENLSENKEP